MITRNINNYSLTILEDKSLLSTYTSSFIEKLIIEKLTIKNRVQICLCGGSTPRIVYEILSKRNITWDKVDIFLGDERFVDPNSLESNTLMLKKSLLQNHASKAYFYEFFKNGNLDEKVSKKLFLEAISLKCIGDPPCFDFTLLGLGDDGHTASLFPYKSNNYDDEYVIFSHGKGLKRISLTPKLISASSKVAFLVSGASKRLALERLISDNESSERTPAKMINSKTEISIFCDAEASKGLKI